MIYIETEQKLRLRYSLKFRAKHFYKTYNYLDENGLLYEEKAFLLEYDDEGIEISYTKWLMVKNIWFIMFPLIIIGIFYFSAIIAGIGFIGALVLHIVVNRLKSSYCIAQMGKNLTTSVYDNLIAKKYNL